MSLDSPETHFLTCGAAEGGTTRNARDAALVEAGLGEVNLLEVGTVVPPGSRLSERRPLSAGVLVPAACAVITSELPGEIISAGISVAYPAEADRPGLIMEYAAPGHKEDVEAIVRRMAVEGLKARGLKIKEIRSIAVQHRVEKIGAAVAAVVLKDH